MAAGVGLMLLRWWVLPPPDEYLHVRLVPLCLWWGATLLPFLALHEGLHALGALVAGVPRDRIGFGVIWKYLMPYCRIRGDFTIGQARVFTVAPLLVTAALSTVAVLVLAMPLAALLLGTSFGAAAGDLFNLFVMRKYRSSDTYREGKDMYEAFILREIDEDLGP